MIRKLSFLVLGVIVILCFGFILNSWSSNRNKNTRELLSVVTKEEQRCIDQEIGEKTLVFIEKEARTKSIYLGYHSRDDYYVSIISVGANNDCVVELQEMVWNCIENKVAVACEAGYEFVARDIRKAELTGELPQEVYIFFDTKGQGKRQNTQHIIYTEKDDGNYQILLHLKMCLGLSSVEINPRSQTILATDDIVCDTFDGRKENIEYSLRNGEITVLADWIDE